MKSTKYSKETFEGLKDDIFDDFFKNKSEADTTSPTNVYATIKVKKEEALNDCFKKVSAKRINAHGKLEKFKTIVKIPEGIEDEQKIVLLSEGNWLKNKKLRSNLVITVIVK